MKKGDVVQLAIIMIALVFAFQTFQYFLSAVTSLLYLFGPGEYVAGTLTPSLTLFLIVIGQGCLSWLLLTRSRSVADFIYEKANIGSSFKIISRPQDLLYILLIVAGMYFLIDELPVLIKALLTAFQSKASSNRFNSYETVKPTDWLSILIQLLLPVILLIAAKPIAAYFAKNISDEPVMIGDDLEQIDTPEIREE